MRGSSGPIDKLGASSPAASSAAVGLMVLHHILYTSAQRGLTPVSYCRNLLIESQVQRWHTSLADGRGPELICRTLVGDGGPTGLG
jgi:hypothetical protein